MKRILLATVALLLSSTAYAADLSVKAPPRGAAKAYPTTSCGMYLGINGEGSAAKVDGVAAGTISTGGTIGGLAGYACPTATFPWFIEAIADYQNIGTSDGVASTSAAFHGEVRAGVQTDLLQLLPQILPGTGTPAGLPTPTPPVLPPGASLNGVPINYFYGALDVDDVSSQFGAASARDWLFSPEVGTGILTPIKLANGKPIVMDTWIGVEDQTKSFCVGTFTCQKFNARWKVGAAVKF